MTSRRSQVSVDFVTNVEKLERDLLRAERDVKRARDLMKEQTAATETSSAATTVADAAVEKASKTTAEHTRSLEINHRALASVGELVRMSVRDYSSLEARLISVIGQGSRVGSIFGGALAGGVAVAGTALAGLAYQWLKNREGADATAQALARVNAEIAILGSGVDQRIASVTAEIQRQAAAVAYLTERRAALAAVENKGEEEASALAHAIQDQVRATDTAVASVGRMVKGLVDADVPFTRLHLLVTSLDGELKDAAIAAIPNYRSELDALNASGRDWEDTLLAQAKVDAQVIRDLETMEDVAARVREEMRGLSTDALAAQLALSTGMGTTLEEMELGWTTAVTTLRRELERRFADQATIEALLAAADPTGRLRGIKEKAPAAAGAAAAGPTSYSAENLALIARLTGGLGGFNGLPSVGQFDLLQGRFDSRRSDINRRLGGLRLQSMDMDARGLEGTDTFKALEEEIAALQESLKRIDLVEDLRLDPFRESIEATRDAIEEATRAEEARRNALMGEVESLTQWFIGAAKLDTSTPEAAAEAAAIVANFIAQQKGARGIEPAIGGIGSAIVPSVNINGDLVVVPESAGMDDVLDEVGAAVTR